MNTNKFFKDVKHAVLHYRVKKCFCVATIRNGLIALGYINAIITALLLLVVTAEEVTYTPPLMAVQKAVLSDDASTMYCILAYAIELGFNCVLLCGMYRNDTVLLRIYMSFVLVTIVSTFLVYSMVFGLVSIFDKLQIVIWDWVYQAYVVLLVWSAIVEIKERNAEGNTHLTLYQVQKPEEFQIQIKSDKPAEFEANMELEKEPKDETSKPKNDEIAPPARKNGETMPAVRKSDETVKPDHKITTIQSKQKNDETAPLPRKNGEDMPHIRKNKESLPSIRKTNEPVPSVLKDDETMQQDQKTTTIQPEQKKDEIINQTNDRNLQPEESTMPSKHKINKARFMSQWR